VFPVPGPLLLRKSGSAGNRTRDLWICSQELWPLDHRGGQLRTVSIINYIYISSYDLITHKSVIGIYHIRHPVLQRSITFIKENEAGKCDVDNNLPGNVI
jgi:hypothetical protein